MRTLSIEEMENKTAGSFWGSFCTGLGIASLCGGFLVPGANMVLTGAAIACFAYKSYGLFS